MKRYPLYVRPLAKILSIILRLLSSTWRIRYSGLENRNQALASSPTKSFVAAIWHQHSLAGIVGQKHRGYVVMVSKSVDGEFIDIPVHDLGFLSARGSSKKGGLEAKEEMAALVRKGHKASMTVDGPRGPRQQVKLGLIDIARQTGAPLIPVGFAYSKTKIFTKSWDHFRLPYPFSKIHFRFGPAFNVPSHLSSTELAPYQEKLRQDMLDQERIANEMMSDWNSLSKGCP